MMKTQVPPLDVVQRWYATRDQALLVSAIEWNVLERWPAGGLYQSAQAVFEEFFPQLLAQFSSYEAVAESFYPSGQTVLVSGFYQGVGLSGQMFRSAFVHIWSVDGEHLTHFRQVADTASVQAVL